MRDGETRAGLHAFAERPRVRFGHRGLDVRDAPAAETREVMVGPHVGVEAGSWPGQFTEQPSVDEESEVPVDGTQAHPWCSADDQSVHFLGRGVRRDTADHFEHCAAGNRQAESTVSQCGLSRLDGRWAGFAYCPLNSHLRDDSHSHQLPRTHVTVRGPAPRVKEPPALRRRWRSSLAGPL